MSKTPQSADGALSGFTAETTLHGFSHLSENGSALRRILWLTFMTACYVGAAVQLVSKWKDFKRKPLLTNLELESRKQLHFPALAICNINQFRITYTREHLYELITDVYKRGTAHPEDVDWEFYEENYAVELARKSTDFLRDAGHKLNDMLIGCEWPNGTRCTTEDFTTTLTEFGVCYVINRQSSVPTLVETSGSNAGMNLLLNVEGYERMNGPTRSYGVKIVLFDADSVPMVSQAIDIPPGYYAQIGMQYQIREKVPVSKGGTCITEADLTYHENTRYSKEACIKDKIVSNIFEKCRCLPAMSIASESSERECTVGEHFKCVVTGFGEPASASECLENCTVVSHSPSLSLSKLPASFFPEILPPAQTLIQTAFHAALHARSRIQQDLVETTRQAIDDLLLVDKYLEENHYRPMVENFRSTYSRLTDEVPCFGRLKNEYSPVFQIAAEWIATDYSAVINDIHCLLIMNSSIYESADNFELFLNNYTRLLVDHGDTIESLKAISENMVATLYQTTNLFLESYFRRELINAGPPEYRELFHSIAQYQDWRISLLELAQQLSKSESLKATIKSFFKTIGENAQDKIVGVLANADYTESWRQLVGNAQERTLSRLLTDAVFLEPQYKNFTCIEMIFQVYMRAYSDAGQSTEWLQLYDPYRFRPPPPDHEIPPQRPRPPGEQRPPQRRKRDVSYSIPSLLVDYKPSDLYLWCPSEAPVDMREMLADLQSCTDHLSTAAEGIFAAVRTMSPDFNAPFDVLVDHLDTFQRSAQLNEDFFQQNMVAINVYYQQMSVQKVKQERAYNIFSFLSDVGGTMGLFLGASIISVFELFDHFMLKPLSKRNGKRAGSVDDEQNTSTTARASSVYSRTRASSISVPHPVNFG